MKKNLIYLIFSLLLIYSFTIPNFGENIDNRLNQNSSAVEAASVSVTIDGSSILVETATLSAIFERATLVSLVRKSDKRELIRTQGKDASGVYLIYANTEAVPFGNRETDRFTPYRINSRKAEFRVEGYDGDGVMTISADPATNDLIVEVGMATSRPGVRSCRWLLSGIDPELELIAPFFQGIKLPLEDPLIANTFWNWPHRWESPLAILQGRTGGLWIHSEDTRNLFKNLQVGVPGQPRALGFDTDAYGPIDNNLSAGGLAWRVNVYEGDWKVPAARYKSWLAETYGLKNLSRPVWMKDIVFAVAWCPNDTTVLEALARRIEPRRILLHAAGFRNRQNEGIPDFTPSPEGKAFFKKAMAMGFHVMPHFPALDIDARHPAYNAIRDFQYRELENKKLVGWTRKDGEGPVPESHADRISSPVGAKMMRMHPGSSLWRSVLAENILKAIEGLGATEAFLDVTMNIHNVSNCLVEDWTPTEAMERLESTVAELGNGLILGGEGRNEVTMRYQAFGQVHLFKSWKTNIPGLDRLTTVPLGEFLYGDWCRAFGYSELRGGNPEADLRLHMQIDQGSVPTITIRTAAEINNPNTGIQSMFDAASGRIPKK